MRHMAADPALLPDGRVTGEGGPLKRRTSAVIAGLTAGLLVSSVMTGAASAAPGVAAGPGKISPTEGVVPQRSDNLSSAQQAEATELKKQAIADVIAGKSTPIQRNGSEIVRVGGKKWVEIKKKADKTDPIFTILVEFGNQTKPASGGTAGPVHNQIAEPDRVYDGGATDDNSTIWAPDFSQEYYQDLLFSQKKESMSDFYFKQSSGRYSVDGDVSDWVTVPYNEATYGSNKLANDAVGYWPFIGDTAAAWYNSQVAAGKTKAEIAAYLKTFDVWDRNDYDGDGNFNEPDGYIDHFQAIHAGEGEEAGGGDQGEDAIWSHRWYAYSTDAGKTGPTGNLQGGVPIGDSGLWIGDYTTEPENGGLGVFCHEFGHDLGLPDMYDTTGGDNGTGFWTIMSAGSWLNHGKQDIGSTPNYMGAWEKLYLGWLDYKTVAYGSNKTVTLGAAGATSGALPQAVVVTLPDQTITTSYNTPYEGSLEWWGGSADRLNNTLTRTIDLTSATSASVTTKAWYQIEKGYDYLYGEVSTDGGATWKDAAAPVTGSSDANADSTPDWGTLTYDLTPFVGKSVQFRFRYATDGGLHLKGPFLDATTITVNGTTTTDPDDSSSLWTAKGFTLMNGSTVRTGVKNFYIAENRQYVGYDATLKTGPYNFGWLNTKPLYVERFPFQNGLLIWYVNYGYGDNNTLPPNDDYPDGHPGYGLALPVDARPTPVVFPDGVRLGNRRQPFDATFGLHKTDSVTFHRNGAAVTVPSQPAIPVFNDTNPNAYYSTANPQNSVKVAGAGVKIQVLTDLEGLVNLMTVKVTTK
jgi:immune inhibitor A